VCQKEISFFLGLSFFLSACTSNYVLTPTSRPTLYWQTQFRSFSDLLSNSSGKTVYILLRDGRVLSGALTSADSNQLSLLDQMSTKSQEFPLASIDHVKLYHNYWWQGAIAGFVVGAIPPIWAGAWPPVPQGNSRTLDYSSRNYVYLGAIGGSVIGLGIGVLITHTDEYDVVADSISRRYYKGAQEH